MELGNCAHMYGRELHGNCMGAAWELHGDTKKGNNTWELHGNCMGTAQRATVLNSGNCMGTAQNLPSAANWGFLSRRRAGPDGVPGVPRPCAFNGISIAMADPEGRVGLLVQ